MAEKYFKIRKDINAFADDYKRKIENLLDEDEDITNAGPYSIRFIIEANFDEIADQDLCEYLRKNNIFSNNLSSNRQILKRFKA